MKKTDLKNYAKLIVRVGARVQKGQEVWVNANVEDAYFVELIVEEAYKVGAKRVFVDWSYDPIDKMTFNYCSCETLSNIPKWAIEKWKYKRDTLPAMIHIESSDPDAMAGIDQVKMMQASRASGKVIRPIRKEMENKYQWTIAAIAGEKWAKKLFPELSAKKAKEKLWDAIFKCARVYGNPIKNWEKHNDFIHEKCDKVNSLGLKKLVYKSSNGTDFSVGLIDDVIFCGAGSYTLQGLYYNPNMPTEECFTSPDPKTAEGVIYASKPLSLHGEVITDFGFRFHEGKVVEVIAKNPKHKEALEALVNIDEGSSKLGEVALVPFNSPVNETGILFFNTLFDENACCHLALGMGFEDTIKDFQSKTREELESYGINDSMIHIDFMVGTSDLDIKGYDKEGKEIQVFKDGTWAI